MEKTSIRHSSAHRTLMKLDTNYKLYVKKGINRKSPVGLWYSQIFHISNSHSFQSFERQNKVRRAASFKSRKVGINDVKILLYKKSLLHHQDIKIMDSLFQDNFSTIRFDPLLKWPGGKTSDWKYIQTYYPYLLPTKIDNYYEPFLGGGAVWLSTVANKMFVNDLCNELISFYDYIKEGNEEFFNYITQMTSNWNILEDIVTSHYQEIYIADSKSLEKILFPYREKLETSFFSSEFKAQYFDILKSYILLKLSNMRDTEVKMGGELRGDDIKHNIECALKGGFYMMIRHIYNSHLVLDPLRVACFYFLRDYSFSSMFRYNKNGEFNVPYGGISYNRKQPDYRLQDWKNPDLIKHINRTSFYRMDFERFLRETNPTENDFIFVDPPYDSEFSTYEKNEFTNEDQKRLAQYLIKDCKSKFIAIMKSTSFIRDLYENKSKDVHCFLFDKKYTVSFKNRNEKDVQHIIVARV